MNATDYRHEPSAEEELVYVFRNRIALFVRTRLHDPSAIQDITQDIQLAVMLALRRGQVRERDRLGAFVYGTARNLINNYLRTRRRRFQTEASLFRGWPAAPRLAPRSDRLIRQRLSWHHLLLARQSRGGAEVLEPHREATNRRGAA